MKIQSVTAHTFGPLREQSLAIQPDMTLIVGANESAKSSWHAAIYAAICGLRRGRGAGRAEDRRFAELHRPWDGDGWRVTARLSLDDGRRIEIDQDLENRVDCRARDLGLGQDVSNEIMYDGSPDVSRWLGLDRRSFAVTACVNQADMRAVVERADSLQEALQRAAATAGTDATAAAALECLGDFLAKHVGQEHRNSTRPLAAARRLLADSESALAAARDQHSRYLTYVDRARERRDASAQAATAVRGCEERAGHLEDLLEAARSSRGLGQNADRRREQAAEHAVQLAREAQRIERARQLAGRLDGQPMPDTDRGLPLVEKVTTALAARQTPPVALPAASADQLRADLAALPEPPTGDTVVDPGVRTCFEEYQLTAALCEEHARQRPPDPARPDPLLSSAIRAGVPVVRDLAGRIERTAADLRIAEELPARDHALSAARARRDEAAEATHLARREVATSQQQREPEPVATVAVRWLLVFPAVAGIGAVVLLGLGHPAVGAAVLAAAVGAAVLIALGIRHRRVRIGAAGLGAADSVARHVEDGTAHAAHTQAQLLKAERELVRCEQLYAMAAAQVEQARRQRADVVQQCASLGLPSDASDLRGLATQADEAAAAEDTFSRWQAEHGPRRQSMEQAQTRLRQALGRRVGADLVGGTTAVHDAYREYERACDQRAAQAQGAERRGDLRRQLVEREAAASREQESLDQLWELAHATGLDIAATAPADQLVDELTNWRETWKARDAQARADAEAWAQLNTLLAGATLDDLATQEAELRTIQAGMDSAKDQAETQAAEAQRAVRECAAAFGLDLTTTDSVEAIGLALHEARRDRETARRCAEQIAGQANTAQGQLDEFEILMPAVAEAEENRAAAQAELDRVHNLKRILQLTQRYLETAQNRVHRDVAPRLTSALKDWLPAVTEGRYIDASVNPKTLEVTVCGRNRRWRDAACLSVGTAEQVYLLLRIALSRQLTRDESCPLLLDDVTVQADDTRTQEILDLLLRLSADQQIIVFSQEPIVEEWARAHLRPAAIHRLDQVPTT